MSILWWMLLVNRFCKYVYPISNNNSLASTMSLQAATHLVLKHSRLLYIFQLDIYVIAHSH